MELKDLSSNWKKLQATIKTDGHPLSTLPNGLKRKRNDTRTEVRSRKTKKTMGNGNLRPEIGDAEVSREDDVLLGVECVNAGLSTRTEIGKYIAIDCEMVGVGPNPDKESALARVSVVNFNGDQVYDSYVRPKEQVTDWRTPVSGILPKHMTEARSLEEVQTDITKILKDRVLVGHAIRNDLDALLLSHPKRDIRDTARHAAYRKLAGGGSPRLKLLASELLGLDIQTAEHSSVEDARASMLLFRRDKDAFEREHAKKWGPARLPQETVDASQPRKTNKKKKKKKR